MIIKEGKPTGFAIDLWEEISEDVQVVFEYEIVDFSKLISGVQKGKFDVGISGTSITSEREQFVDFSHHFLDASLATLVRADSGVSFLSVIGTLSKKTLLMSLFWFVVFLVFCGHVLWFSERGADAITDTYVPGIFEATWCVLATATTVGYGDIAPKRWLGRAAAFFVMLGGIGFFGVLSAELMSALTTYKLSSQVVEMSDLRGKTVATLQGSTSVGVIQSLGGRLIATKTIEESYQKLLDEEVDAVIFDSPSLSYFALTEGAGKVEIVDSSFSPQHYGFVFNEGSKLREDVNRALLEMRSDGRYQKIYQRWFGEN